MKDLNLTASIITLNVNIQISQLKGRDCQIAFFSSKTQLY